MDGAFHHFLTPEIFLPDLDRAPGTPQATILPLVAISGAFSRIQAIENPRPLRYTRVARTLRLFSIYETPAP